MPRIQGHLLIFYANPKSKAPASKNPGTPPTTENPQTTEDPPVTVKPVIKKPFVIINSRGDLEVNEEIMHTNEPESKSALSFAPTRQDRVLTSKQQVLNPPRPKPCRQLQLQPLALIRPLLLSLLGLQLRTQRWILALSPKSRTKILSPLLHLQLPLRLRISHLLNRPPQNLQQSWFTAPISRFPTQVQSPSLLLRNPSSKLLNQHLQRSMKK